MQLPGVASQSKGPESPDKIEEVWNSAACDFVFSIVLFCFFIAYREELTPEFFHFVTCMVEEEGHFIWIMFLWLTYKCYLTMDPTVIQLLT